MDDICQAVGTHLPCPWLVFSHEIYTQKQTFYSLLKDRYHTKIIPKMRSKCICLFDHGWLLLQDDLSNRYSPLNMTTMVEEIQLPDLPDPVVASHCKILTSSPRDSNCKIMFIDSYVERCIMSCHPCDDHFVKHYFTIIGGDDNDDHLRVATYMNGKLYGLALPSYGLVIADHNDLINSTSTPIRFQKLIQDESFGKTLAIFLTIPYLTVCNGDVLLILMTFFAPCHENVTGFRLFRMDHSTKAWTEVKSIGDDHAIFLDKERAFCFPVRTSKEIASTAQRRWIGASTLIPWKMKPLP